MGQPLQVGLGGADLGDGGRVAELLGEVAHRLDRLVTHVVEIAGVGVLNAERVGDVTVLLAGVLLVVFHDRRQQDAVGHAVGHAEAAAQRVRHAVHQAQADVRVGHAGDVGGVRHLFAGGDVALGGLGQVLGDHADGLHRQAVGQAPRTRGDIALDGVGQRVQTGGHLERARLGVGQIRVHERDDRDVMRVDGHELALVRRIGDHVVDGGLRGGAGGGRHAEDRHGRVLGGGHALQREHVGEFGVGGDDADALAGVLRGAAAQADQEVGAGVGELGHAVLDAFDRRVRLDVAEDLIRHARLVEHVGDLLDGAGFDQHRIGDDERLGEAVRLGHVRNLLDRTAAEVRLLVENHAIDHTRPPLSPGSFVVDRSSLRATDGFQS